jgi:hypothetical protein
LSSIFNYGAPNPDLTYKVVHLQPAASYRVWGRRGNSQMIDVAQMSGWFGQNKNGLNATTLVNQLFDEQNIAIDADGNFSFIMSPHPQEGAWWKLEDGATELLLRDYYADYEIENRPTVFHFDMRDEQFSGATIPSMATAVGQLDSLVRALKDLTPFFMIPKIFAGVGENHFQELNFGNAGGANDQHYFHARFAVEPDEALIGTWKVPENCLYWSAQLYGDMYQSLNWGNRQVNLNHGLANVSPDGMFYFIISHRDTGIANWLDVDGHKRGLVMTRTKGCTKPEMPSLRLVPVDQISKYLPSEIAMVTQSERARNLASRRKHFQIRENC